LENCILIDWLSITSKIHSPQDFIRLLGLQDCVFESVGKGANGYQDRLYYDHISIHYNGREDMGVWLELSGQGCRVFETLGHGNYDVLFGEVMDNEDQMHITRLDVAFDDHTGILDMDQLVRDTMDLDEEGKPLHFVSRAKMRGVEWQHEDCQLPALTVYHGRKASDLMIRIYDKAAERGYLDRHWVRTEIQMRDDRALEFARKLFAGAEIGDLFRGVLYNYLRYVDDPGGDSNRRRWPLKGYWQRLLDGAHQIRLYVRPGMEYNMLNLEQFVIKQAGNAVAAYLEIRGQEAFMEAIRKRGLQMPLKYRQLIDQHKRGWYN
jgi:phage replication initiation protein